jgi:hypothetical protein
MGWSADGRCHVEAALAVFPADDLTCRSRNHNARADDQFDLSGWRR